MLIQPAHTTHKWGIFSALVFKIVWKYPNLPGTGAFVVLWFHLPPWDGMTWATWIVYCGIDTGILLNSMSYTLGCSRHVVDLALFGEGVEAFSNYSKNYQFQEATEVAIFFFWEIFSLSTISLSFSPMNSSLNSCFAFTFWAWTVQGCLNTSVHELCMIMATCM